MSLKQEIKDWDTKDTTYIKRVYVNHFQEQEFYHSLLTLFSSTEHQDGATWLFKHAFDTADLVAEAVDPSLVRSMCSVLDQLQSWPAQLHVLQILSLVPIPGSCTDHIESFALSCMTSKKTFVRAWSYSALYAATRNDPSKHQATVLMLKDTLNDDSTPASVKARIRNTLI